MKWIFMDLIIPYNNWVNLNDIFNHLTRKLVYIVSTDCGDWIFSKKFLYLGDTHIP